MTTETTSLKGAQAETKLIVSGFTAGALEITPQAQALKAKNLASAKAVATVASTEEQKLAVAVVGEMKGLLKKLEESRVEVKEPFLTRGREIDEAAKKYRKELDDEVKRIEALVASYALAVAAAAEAERQAKLKAERERLAAEAEAKRLEAARIAEKAQTAFTPASKEALTRQAEEVKASAETLASTVEDRALIGSYSAPAAPKAQGVSIGEKWTFEVLDILALVKARPDLCRIEANTSEINKAISLGSRDIPGLKISQQTKATIRAAA